ncbi:glycerol-3-phosphate 1-O-acyltransferase PlsB [Halomonas sp. 328]|uniref:glycerol-3-phosphate 1-O-acyltransferase PlsB n=1 Tax=Halomonas sp. 328 TaxID=2776704 RepID=UPI0018A7002A|nr:glycerol-3-phosphate 1-O-acyltransferase PlsB [Halomonas sp. 328]MBF8221801.1 glycerol-3-phosphate 1-O-acyltransferase PlsB [Halomonas sp. 328]
MAWRPLHALLRRLLDAWVEVRHCDPAPDTLALDPERPTLYVLPHRALSDRLLLESLCRRHGLPLDASLGSPAILTLPEARRRPWRRRRSPSPLVALAQRLEASPGAAPQLVPVSIFWGRAPGKRFGFWKLLAADSWALTGRLRRLLAVGVNGRSVEVVFGAPLRLDELHDPTRPELTSRKAGRLLRVHFRRVRTRVLGPDLSHRRTLIESVVASPEVRRAIDEAAGAQEQSRSRLTRRAQRYGREIASNMSYPVLRFMDQLLKRLWTRLYDGVEITGIESVKALAGDHTLVYVPCHRSHIDYLLLSYVLYHQGLMPPHIAAGRNLDMPVVGPLLRRGGAFFMRRSFRDNRLYAAVFDAYLHRLLAHGHALEYFIEGGRSRSGRQLAPRPGMLAMSLRSQARLIHEQRRPRPLAFVPVYFGYERVMENASYRRELAGEKKRKESPLALLGTLKRLREPFGQVTVAFGEPLILDAWLDEHAPEWRRAVPQGRPAWLKQVLPTLGQALSRRINAAVRLNASNLVALAMLATPQRVIETPQLEHQLRLLARLGQGRPGEPLAPPEGSPADWIDHTERLGLIQRRPQALGELVVADADQATLLGWYRNNVLHGFALPGLVAFAFRNTSRHDASSLARGLSPIWPLLVRELAITPPEDLTTAITEQLGQLTALGLLEATDAGWRRPRALPDQAALDQLGALVEPFLARGFLLLTVLLRQPSGQATPQALADQGRQLAERLALLSGLPAPEFFDASLFAALLEGLEAEGWVWRDDDRVHYGATLQEAARHAQELFDPALRQRLMLLAEAGEEVS